MLAFLGAAVVCRAADLNKLPPNTWVEIKYTTEQPSGHPDEKGQWRPVGWNKLVYDPNGKRVLFYDRWVDRKFSSWRAPKAQAITNPSLSLARPKTTSAAR